MTKVLMLNFDGDPSPFSYQVSDQTYEKYKHLEGIETAYNKEAILKLIEDSELKVRRKLFEDIERHKTKCIREIQLANRVEKSEKLAKSIFS